MQLGVSSYPLPANEPVLSYAPGTPEKAALKKALKDLKKSKADIPMYIGSEEVRTGVLKEIRPPHETKFLLGHYHLGDKTHVKSAINAALKAKEKWAALSWDSRAHIFLKAADLIATKYRAVTNAATMLAQSKNPFQSEIDAVCEMIDFLRFNVHFLDQIYREQPISSPGTKNRMEYRPLEGFVAAITPFNFTSIGGNLPTSAAMCGNVVVWKCAHTQVYSAELFMKILKEAGLPDGVINLVYASGPTFGDVVFNHPDFAGIHFTGSTAVFKNMWKQIGENTKIYKSYPRIVGETGGKDFVLVHKSADVDEVVAALCRGAFEYQGQKCSAASRAYLPSNLAADIKKKLVAEIKTMKMGTVEDFTNFINAVIDEKSFDKLEGYIKRARKDKQNAKILVGGKCDKTNGYFIEPTVIEALNPKYETMCEELFGPVLTIYTYDADKFDATIKLLDSTSPYALTGSIFAKDRAVIESTTQKLMNNAGNFYINDKPTGAVVGQQPFGGARGSGTNDKAGSILNLYRWLSARTIKETFVSPTDYRYPFMQEP
ncbi:MAG: L-glutamate gamma-semialdehyde dehydrogenase [Chitinophagaceae bacterium]|nr:L-glutamate gamma-semialdehyde dehydrogenase [Chitinophagaceae bacterium]